MIVRRAGQLVRVAAALTAAARLSRVVGRYPPIAPVHASAEAISVVVPARDEADRLPTLLAALAGAPGVVELLVVDDESTDDTAAVAALAGATVLPGRPLPPGWVGKAWALHQGLEAATGEWVVTLDADCRPDPRLPASLVARCRTDRLDLLTAAGSFECPTRPLAVLHPALLTTLLYRVAPPGARRAGAVHRRMGNGQCTVVSRERLLAAGGWRSVGHQQVEDVALVRAMASAGFAVGFLDASALLRVRMYETAAEAWTGWGRSLALPGVDPPGRRVVDLLVVAVAQALPLVRLVTRRADALDVGLLVLRAGTLVGTAGAYRPGRWAYWLSPLADGAAVLALAGGGWRRRRTWRGRAY